MPILKKITLGIVIIILIGSCNGSKEQNHEPLNEIAVTEPVVNIENGNECLTFLKGKSFFSNKARIDFQYDNNAYIFSLADNRPIFTGYISIEDNYVPSGRIVRIHDTIGSGNVIILILNQDGTLADMSDNSKYQTH
jgi:hypothetical protein